MKRNKSSNKLAMERILFSRDATRLRRDDQYLNTDTHTDSEISTVTNRLI